MLQVLWNQNKLTITSSFSHGQQPKAGREIQAELNRRRIKNNGGREGGTFSEKPAEGKCYSSESTIIITVGNMDSQLVMQVN